MSTPTPTLPKKKQYKDIYEGGATVVSVDANDLRFTDGLTDDEAARAFIIAFRVKPDDDKIGEHTLELEFSDRECRQKEHIGKKQKDVTREELFRRKLIDGADSASADISTVFDSAVGKKVSIRIVEVTDPNRDENNVRRSVYFSNRPPALSKEERARRIALMTGQPVPAAAPAAAKPVTQNPF